MQPGPPSRSARPPVPIRPISLPHRTRTALLALLLVVLPLQGVLQWVAGLQGHRHVHISAAAEVAPSPLPSTLRVLLDRLHAAQDPRLQPRAISWLLGQADGSGLHAHDGVVHSHAPTDADVVALGDPAEDAGQAGATAFLAWLPLAWALPAGEGAARPAPAPAAWRNRVVAPPLTPPRG